MRPARRSGLPSVGLGAVTLVDTGPLVALCDPHDRQHLQAIAQLSSIGRSGLRTCEAVVSEAFFHLPAPSQRRRLERLLDELDITALQTHDAVFRADAFSWAHKYAEHEPDWADACLAVLCGRHRHAKVWTYDREFRTTWRKPDGRPIPLAVRDLK